MIPFPAPPDLNLFRAGPREWHGGGTPSPRHSFGRGQVQILNSSKVSGANISSMQSRRDERPCS